MENSTEHVDFEEKYLTLRVGNGLDRAVSELVEVHGLRKTIELTALALLQVDEAFPHHRVLRHIALTFLRQDPALD